MSPARATSSKGLLSAAFWAVSLAVLPASGMESSEIPGATVIVARPTSFDSRGATSMAY